MDLDGIWMDTPTRKPPAASSRSSSERSLFPFDGADRMMCLQSLVTARSYIHSGQIRSSLSQRGGVAR